MKTVLAILLVVTAAAVPALLAARQESQPQRQDGRPPTVVERSAGTVAQRIPRHWRRVSSTHAGVTTWAAPGRLHTVTAAAVRASDVPLSVTVAQAAVELRRSLPIVSGPVAVDLRDRAPMDTHALRMTVHQPDSAPVEVVQVWRRDSERGVDAVSTWTSADGSWPLDPAAIPPRVRT